MTRTRLQCVVQTIETPLGPLLAGALPHGICLLEYTRRERLEPQLTRLRRHLDCDTADGASPHLTRLEAELAGYFAGTRRDFTLPLVLAGTPFQERVWRALLEIPYGATRSYEQLSQVVAAEGAQRAVGHANGSNRIAIVVPCHRVINKSGNLGGYGGELWRKQALLGLEAGRPLLDFTL
jgi:AraC family transcriptional regulator of adaptative response/methylated-DNA-[protein]-cysteine methyltransferase